MPNKTILLSAGEISGDRHGARLAKALLDQAPHLKLVGMGGPAMKAAGVEILCDVTDKSTVGLLEPIRHLRPLLKAMKALKTYIKTHQVDAVVPIDYQGFNLLLLKFTHARQIPNIYYISPQEWQWGTEKGGKAVAALCNKILCIFKDEADFYSALGAEAPYVGHPITDIQATDKPTAEWEHIKALAKGKTIISIFPGSRPQEIKHTAPVLLQAAKKIESQFPNAIIVVSVVHDSTLTAIQTIIKKTNLNAIIYQGPSLQLISQSSLSLSCSGTITLEHAMLGTPIVAAFRFNPISFYLIKKVISKKWLEKVKYISLPNILTQRIIMPEFLQDAATPESIAKAGLKLLQSQTDRDAIMKEFAQLKSKLGDAGTAKRAAAEILKTVYNKPRND
jgi:lipid-A-disaccharide synthase